MKTIKMIKNEKGAAVVEFAIVLPLLVLFFCGMIEFGLLFYNKQVITNASREGARAAITKTLTAGDLTASDRKKVEDITKDYCKSHLINLVSGVDDLLGTPVVSSPDAENDITVTVTYNYNLLFSKVIGVGNIITLTGQTVMRME